MQFAEWLSLTGTVPRHLVNAAMETVTSIDDSIFLDSESDSPTQRDEFDRALQSGMETRLGKKAISHVRFGQSRYNCDLGFTDYGLLVEIEKGALPRLELDILKFIAAAQSDRGWKFGMLLVPINHIQLRLSGNRSPYEHLRSLHRMLGDSLAPVIDGIHVLGYIDPRGDG